MSMHANATGTAAVVRPLVRRYRERLQAHVAERDGGRFDIALTVDGVEVAWINLLSEAAFGVHHGVDGTVMGSTADGLVELPA